MLPSTECEAIFRQFSVGHTLYGMNYQDFIGQNEKELAEVIDLIPSLADKRALSRIYRQNRNTNAR